MNTFLPYESFSLSAQVLDRQRLGKQRVEVYQMLRSLVGESSGWLNHPCTRMWDGYEAALAEYGLAVCDEWIARGYNDTCREKIGRIRDRLGAVVLPDWMGDTTFHLSHMSNLLRKNPDWYVSRFPVCVSHDAPYVWPV